MAASMSTDEVAKLRKQYDETVAAGRATTSALDQLRLRQAALWSDMERAYFASTAPRLTGLKAMQVSIAQSHFNERIAQARKAVRGDSARKLLDRVDVVMARLEMLELGNFDTEGAFRDMVRKGDLAKQLEAALESQGESPEVRGVLFEARMILGGVERVS